MGVTGHFAQHENVKKEEKKREIVSLHLIELISNGVGCVCFSLFCLFVCCFDGQPFCVHVLVIRFRSDPFLRVIFPSFDVDQ
jgi:hypothetical protein